MEENKSLNNEESVEEYEIDFIKEAEKYNIYSEEDTKVSLKTKIAVQAHLYCLYYTPFFSLML